ncbi:MAG: peptidylprolyl isomerase [Planctomycetes bacterium]|nr:peptidylprolyl isomerase [Planctomycetota bacterium]
MSARRAAGLLALLLLAAGAARAGAQDGHSHGPRPGARPVPPEAFAMVGDVAILRSEVYAEVARGFRDVVALQRLIATEVMRQNLVRVGFDPAAVTDAELDQGVAEARAALVAQGGTPAQVAHLEQVREALRVPVAFSRFVATQVPDEALAGDFDMWRMVLAGEVRLRAIALRIDPARGGPQGVRERVEQLKAKLGEAPTDAQFAALAAEVSEDPVAALTGGDLDWQSARAPTVSLTLIEPAITHAAAGRRGLVPAPVVTQRAAYLLYVTAVRVPATATLDALLPRMREQARAQAASRIMDEWLEETPLSIAEDAPHIPVGR